MESKKYINGHVTLFKKDGSLISQEELDEYLDKYIEFIESNNMAVFAHHKLINDDELDFDGYLDEELE
jgi:hypothetical protein